MRAGPFSDEAVNGLMNRRFVPFHFDLSPRGYLGDNHATKWVKELLSLRLQLVLVCILQMHTGAVGFLECEAIFSHVGTHELEDAQRDDDPLVHHSLQDPEVVLLREKRHEGDEVDAFARVEVSRAMALAGLDRDSISQTQTTSSSGLHLGNVWESLCSIVCP